MSCAKWQRRIALYVGGDLAQRKARQTEEHLSACSECRALAGDLRQSQAILKGATEEELEANLAAVRQRVFARVATHRDRRRTAWLLWALAPVTAALLMVAMLWRPQPVPELEFSVNAQIPSAPLNRPEPPVRPRRAPATRHELKPAEPVEPMVVKFLTDDPDVVIVWLIEPKGD